MSSTASLRAGAVVAALALVLSACGSSDNGSDGPALGKDTGGLKGEPVKIMAIAPVATPIQDYPDVIIAAKAAADDINKDGGIDGSPIELLTCNDKSDANGAVACARRAVEEKAVAVIAATVNGAAMYPVLQKAGIPVVAQTQTPPDWTEKGVYLTNLGSVVASPAAPFVYVDEGLKSIAFVRTEVAANAKVPAQVEAAAKKAGIEYKGTIAIPVDASDFAPFVQKLKAMNADGVTFATSAGQGIQFIRAARQLGLKTVFSANAGSFGTKEIAELGPAAEGFLLIDGAPSPLVSGIGSIDRLNKAMDRAEDAGEKGADKRGARTSGAWIDVHALAAVLKAQKVEAPVTADAVSKALESAKDVDVEGLFAWTPSAPGVTEWPRVSNGEVYVGELTADGSLEMRKDKLDIYEAAGYEPVGG